MTEENDTLPPPPPPLPTVTSPSAQIGISNSPSTHNRSQSRQSIVSTMSNGDRMQEELTSVLTLVRERSKQKHLLDIKQTPETYINQKSNPTEVKEWLAMKGFNEIIQNKFEGVAGHDLFDMNKTELERVCGQEGKRLYSQLNIQKSISGYQTVRTTELKAILARARQKIESEKN